MPAAVQAAAKSATAALGGNLERERLLLDFGWRFHFGHAWDQAKDFGFGADAQTFAKPGSFPPVCQSNFNDGDWERVDLPHDWAVGLPFVNARPLVAHGCKSLGRNYPETSIGWYRRVFDLPASDLGRRFVLDFDGVFRNSMVVFNGYYLSENTSGYAPFHCDVTDFVNYGGRNVLVVRVDATLNEGWFYEGAGIYRHVWLTKTSPMHVAHWGTFVQSKITSVATTVGITTEIDNDSDSDRPCQVLSTIVAPSGKPVATTGSPATAVLAGSRRAVEQQLRIPNPALWSPEQPNMYLLQTAVEEAGRVVDRYETPFGIRTFHFDPDKGFFLNGKLLKIKGACNHQDHGGLGSALPDRLHAYRIEKLKELGANGWRSSHNPPAAELLDACDRLGMLMLDETRMFSSSPEGLSQIERLIRRDRNHPSVFMWCVGNEEREQTTERGARIAASLREFVRKLDPTRPVTVAQNRDFGKGVSASVDVQGCNYREEQIDGFHKNFPKRPMVGTETGSIVSTRGIYETDREKGYVGAFDSKIYRWPGAAQDWWKVYAERPFLAGAFTWTGFDYRGEPTPYGWPCINSHFGIFDMCGFPKDNYYYYKAWWQDQPVLYVLPHWNWHGKEGQELEVWVHSNLERVELLLNGQSLGAQDVTPNTRLVWKVRYAPGTLEARGFKSGAQISTFKRETTGPAARVVLRPDRQEIKADGEDVSMVAVEIQDQQGRVAPTANNEVTFKITGAGRLIGVCNGDPSSHEQDKADKRMAFNGLCMAIVQASRQAGEIRMEASAPGLQGAAATIHCRPSTPRPAVT
jgi:beta-galactosidase